VTGQNIEAVRQIFEGVNQELLEAMPTSPALRAAFEHYFTEDLQWVMVDGRGGDALTYEGLDGAIEAMNDHLRPWTEYRHLPGRYIDAGEVVVVLGHESARAKSGEKHLDTDIGGVWRFRGPKIARVEHFQSHEQALHAAGLDPAESQAPA
jgi:ketosteroid isomerase-like protein